MLIKITETNMWEREKWSYILDLSKQDSSSINYLMIFIRVANEQFEIDKENAKKNGLNYYASSRYSFTFFDSYIIEESIILKNPYVVLLDKTHKKQFVLNNNDNGYKIGGLMLDKIISNAKMKSAMIAMRDKKQNKLYKSFEDVFLKGKVSQKNELINKNICKTI